MTPIHPTTPEERRLVDVIVDLAHDRGYGDGRVHVATGRRGDVRCWFGSRMGTIGARFATTRLDALRLLQDKVCAARDPLLP